MLEFSHYQGELLCSEIKRLYGSVQSKRMATAACGACALLLSVTQQSDYLALVLSVLPGVPPTLPLYSVTAVTESGLMIIMTGWPLLSLARTRKDSGIILMSVKPAC